MNINLEFTEPDWGRPTMAKICQLAEEHRAELDASTQEGRFPATAFGAMGKACLLGSLTPKEHGGMGVGIPEY